MYATGGRQEGRHRLAQTGTDRWQGRHRLTQTGTDWHRLAAKGGTDWLEEKCSQCVRSCS